MDTDHPFFQQPAAEYDDPLEDQFIEELIEEARKKGIAFTLPQLRIIRWLLSALLRRLIDGSHVTTPQHYREMERLSAIFAYINDASNPAQASDCVAYSFGLICRDGESMDSIAKRHGVARQAFSDQVGRFQEEFNIAPRSGMRPRHQKKMYEDIQRARQKTIWTDISPSLRRRPKQAA
jgi:hypothetical protein